MAIKTLFFDLGGVLINFSHEKMCENIAQICGLDKAIVKAHLFEKNLSELYERGEIDSETLHQHFCQLSNCDVSREALMNAAAQIFSPKVEMPPLLENLKRQNRQLFLLSNTCEAHFLFAKKHFSFLNLFDGCILSYEIKARKPEKKIYEAALEQSDSKSHECFFTDDVEENVVAASQLGIHSHLFEGIDGLRGALKERGIDA